MMPRRQPLGEGPVATSVLLSICVYEATALTTGRVPTISALLRARSRRDRLVVVCVASAWLAAHMLHPRWP